MAKSTLSHIFSLVLLILAISIRNQVARAANTACVESWSDLKGCTSVGYLPCKQECIRKYGSASYGYCANISHCICVFVCVLIN
ncbi:hypothetical protein HN51_026882 [Arachis hypogaea]|nr:uncharacterized protein DS421_9g255510 [Arachis hypogaea]